MRKGSGSPPSRSWGGTLFGLFLQVNEITLFWLWKPFLNVHIQMRMPFKEERSFRPLALCSHPWLQPRMKGRGHGLASQGWVRSAGQPLGEGCAWTAAAQGVSKGWAKALSVPLFRTPHSFRPSRKPGHSFWIQLKATTIVKTYPVSSGTANVFSEPEGWWLSTASFKFAAPD